MSDPYAVIQEWTLATGCATPKQANAELLRLQDELAAEREARQRAEEGVRLADGARRVAESNAREAEVEVGRLKTAYAETDRRAAKYMQQVVDISRERAEARESVRLWQGTAADNEAWARKVAEEKVQAERERDEAKALHLSDLQEARDALGQCIRERDNARALLDASVRASLARQEEVSTEKAARERAEASNAALLKDRLEMCPGCDGAGSYLAVDADPAKDERKPCPSCAYVRERPHPGAALLEVANLLRQYQHREEADLLATLRRLREERGKVAHMVDPAQHSALLEESERRRALLEAVAKACRGLGPETEEVKSVVGRVLERLRALEEVRKACEPTRRRAERRKAKWNLLPAEGDEAFLDACAKADALKGGGA